jgi:hypothetical protein
LCFVGPGRPHRIHPRNAVDRIDTDNVIVAIDIDDFSFGQP